MTSDVSESLLKGNYGEHLVAQILSRSCFVRPVVGNTDVGVDLYCESIIEGKTFLHFWVQVKTSKNIPNRQEEFKFPFKTSSLEYWAKQPVPVLALLVPLEWPPENINVIHVIDITFGILEHGIKKDQAEQSFETIPHLTLPLTDEKKLSDQLYNLLLHHLPMTVSAIFAEKGFLYPAPKPTEEYTKFFSSRYISRYIDKIGMRIHHSVSFGVMQYIDAGNDINKLPKIIVAGLKAISDDPHYEVSEALGVLYQARKDFIKAKSYYEKAIKSIVDDTNIDHNKPPWSENMERLKKRISSLQ